MTAPHQPGRVPPALERAPGGDEPGGARTVPPLPLARYAILSAVHRGAAGPAATLTAHTEEYLEEEVVNGLPPDHRAFLEQTSICGGLKPAWGAVTCRNCTGGQLPPTCSGGDRTRAMPHLFQAGDVDSLVPLLLELAPSLLEQGDYAHPTSPKPVSL